jgi:preprotein translocase subunit SecF
MPSFAKFGNDLYTGRRSIDFVGRRRLWYLIAAVAVALSLLGLGVRGLNLGLEFTGGSEFQVSKAKTMSQSAGSDAVHSVVPGVEARVSTVGGDGIRITTKIGAEQIKAVQLAVAKAYGVPEGQVSSQFIGPTWGRDVSNKALQGLVVFLIAVALVIALYFRTWKMALAAIIALVHDLLLTVGVYAIVGFEVTPASVIGFLTILGYSLYDTVVVFDKVRENTDHITATTKRNFAEAANLAINQTLVRSINTSVVALLPVASILFIGTFLLGTGVLKDIALSLFVGIAAGTYSSIFIATPLLAHLREIEPEMKAQADRVRRKRAEAGPATSDVVEDDDAEQTSADADVLAVVGAGGAQQATGEAEPDAASSPARSGRGSTGGSAPGSAGESGSSGSGGAGRQSAAGQRQQPRRGGSNRGRSSGRKR